MGYIYVAKTKRGMGYNYTPLNVIAKLLSENGIDFRQRTRRLETGEWVVETSVKFPLHGENSTNESLGSWGEWTAPVPIIVTHKTNKQGRDILTGAQEFGSALTYARRYSLMVAANVVPDDDDGAAAGQVREPITDKQKKKADGSRMAAQVMNIARQHGWSRDQIAEQFKETCGDIAKPGMATKQQLVALEKIFMREPNVKEGKK